MKRTRIDAEMVTDRAVLVRAAVTAARGKRRRPDVIRFFSDFDRNITILRNDLLSGAAPYNRFRCFTIFDPKERVITAVSFEDRIIHHALMCFAAPVFEKAMVAETYACRPGKGPLAAVHRAQKNIGRYPWYVQIDVEKYFESIDHEILFQCLARKFKGAFFHDLVHRIVMGYETAPRRGLPIGSLTSQYFANFYLDRLDRLIAESTPARAYLRYMDDMLWWCNDKRIGKETLATAAVYAESGLHLKIKDTVRIQRSSAGVPFCGFRVLPGRLRLSRRKKRRYVERKRYWEEKFAAGEIDVTDLQRAYDAVRGMVVHASATSWMRQREALCPSPVEV